MECLPKKSASSARFLASRRARSPDGAKRNPGSPLPPAWLSRSEKHCQTERLSPDYALLHPGYAPGHVHATFPLTGGNLRIHLAAMDTTFVRILRSQNTPSLLHEGRA
jgi:hypothetical protein